MLVTKCKNSNNYNLKRHQRELDKKQKLEDKNGQ